MKSDRSRPIRMDLRFHEESDASLYAHLTAMPPRLRSEFLRHLARLGWLVHQGLPLSLPAGAGSRDNRGKAPCISRSHALDQDLLAALEAEESGS